MKVRSELHQGPDGSYVLQTIIMCGEIPVVYNSHLGRDPILSLGKVVWSEFIGLDVNLNEHGQKELETKKAEALAKAEEAAKATEV